MPVGQRKAALELGEKAGELRRNKGGGAIAVCPSQLPAVLVVLHQNPPMRTLP